jgi:hypothetical protein
MNSPAITGEDLPLDQNIQRILIRLCLPHMLLDQRMPIARSLMPSDPFILEVGPASFNPIASGGPVPLLFEMGKILGGVDLRF